jgi:hypothetical protein
MCLEPVIVVVADRCYRATEVVAVLIPLPISPTTTVVICHAFIVHVGCVAVMVDMC